MHENFNPDQPVPFTRSWSAWANSLLTVLVMTVLVIDEQGAQPWR